MDRSPQEALEHYKEYLESIKSVKHRNLRQYLLATQDQLWSLLQKHIKSYLLFLIGQEA